MYQNFNKIKQLTFKNFVYFFTIHRNDKKEEKKEKRKEEEEKGGEWSVGQEREVKIYDIYSIFSMQHAKNSRRSTVWMISKVVSDIIINYALKSFPAEAIICGNYH